MRRGRPCLETVEGRVLLSNYNLDFAGFQGNIQLDTSDQTAHTAWAFPGMQIEL